MSKLQGTYRVNLLSDESFQFIGNGDIVYIDKDKTRYNIMEIILELKKEVSELKAKVEELKKS